MKKLQPFVPLYLTKAVIIWRFPGFRCTDGADHFGSAQAQRVLLCSLLIAWRHTDDVVEETWEKDTMSCCSEKVHTHFCACRANGKNNKKRHLAQKFRRSVFEWKKEIHPTSVTHSLFLFSFTGGAGGMNTPLIGHLSRMHTPTSSTDPISQTHAYL